jgi:ribonuclease HI
MDGVEVFIDGLCEPRNPHGVACWGFVIYKDGVKLHEECGAIGHGEGMSNNLAEYTALYNALKKLKELGLEKEKISVNSDSMLVICQMSGMWLVNGGLYYPAYQQSKKVSKLFGNIEYNWIPRERNKEADELSRRAYLEYCKKHDLKPVFMKRN